MSETAPAGTLIEQWIFRHWPAENHEVIGPRKVGEDLQWRIRKHDDDDTVAVRIQVTDRVHEFPNVASRQLAEAEEWVPRLRSKELRGIRIWADRISPWEPTEAGGA